MIRKLILTAGILLASAVFAGANTNCTGGNGGSNTGDSSGVAGHISPFSFY